jgi:hypothetical protein
MLPASAHAVAWHLTGAHRLWLLVTVRWCTRGARGIRLAGRAVGFALHSDAVLVHGDYRPNNVLRSAAKQITAKRVGERQDGIWLHSAEHWKWPQPVRRSPGRTATRE